MTAEQSRQKVASSYTKILGRNTYSQDLDKRECAFTKYKDGKYYSDCSSSIRLAYKDAGIITNIGGNTVAQYESKLGKEINVGIVNGVPTKINNLRVGDCIYFAGTDTSRAYADYCGHVEMVYKIEKDKVTLCGHGSGNPSTKDMKQFCTSRFNSKTNTKKGNKGAIKVIRFIQDDEKIKAVKPTTTVSSKSKAPEVLWVQQKANKVITRTGLVGENGIKLDKLDEDGIFGSKSKEFVKAFWNLMGWKSSSTTGNAGPNTIKALDQWK